MTKLDGTYSDGAGMAIEKFLKLLLMYEKHDVMLNRPRHMLRFGNRI